MAYSESAKTSQPSKTMSTTKPSKNALSHGAYSSEATLPWENKQDFDDLHEELKEELFPNGRSEEEAVFDIACLRWKKRRLIIGSQLAFLRDPDISALTDAGHRNGWEGISEHFAKTLDNNESARDSMRSINKAVREMVVPVYQLVTKQMTKMLVADGSDQDSKQHAAAELEKLTVLIREMKAGAGVVGGALRIIENNCLDERPCERAYRPDLMERELKILADIDKRIEKAMVHLISLKEYKKLYGTKEVKALQTEAPRVPSNNREDA